MTFVYWPVCIKMVKEYKYDFEIRLVLHQLKIHKFSLHIHSFCTLTCTWSNADLVRFFFHAAFAYGRKQPLIKLIKTFLICQLKEETFFFIFQYCG